MYLNKVQLIGNLTRDPELKALPSGTKVASFSIATNRNWKDKDGVKKEEVEFHNLIAFGKTAEVIAQWCKKGSQIYVEGRLQTRSWDANGQKMYRTEIVVDQFQFGNSPRTETKPSPMTEKDHFSPDEPAVDVDDGGPIDYPDEENNLEDIPF
jgi:single-strand DNA-binding protein